MGVVPVVREHAPAVVSTIASTRGRPHSGARRLKRGLDVMGALLVCLGLAPFLLLIAAAVRWSSPGPVLHRRRVVGLGGRTFDAFKFRTMRVDAGRAIEVDASMWAAYVVNFKLPDDPRITRLGRWLRRYSIDELPQLFNVLRGEMALVGPRMITEPELVKYGQHAGRLVSVRPGLTGLWQVSGRQTTTYERRVELDLFYIDHWSLWLDLRILCKTPLVVIRGEGAY
jgi:lipopolysaccharide/colanic/teichoic acid biosynthesis glycosyltransferase